MEHTIYYHIWKEAASQWTCLEQVKMILSCYFEQMLSKLRHLSAYGKYGEITPQLRQAVADRHVVCLFFINWIIISNMLYFTEILPFAK